jgi:hypothetical protein
VNYLTKVEEHLLLFWRFRSGKKISDGKFVSCYLELFLETTATELRDKIKSMGFVSWRPTEPNFPSLYIQDILWVNSQLTTLSLLPRWISFQRYFLHCWRVHRMLDPSSYTKIHVEKISFLCPNSTSLRFNSVLILLAALQPSGNFHVNSSLFLSFQSSSFKCRIIVVWDTFL